MPVFFKDRAGIYRGCNLAFTTLLGLCPADVVGKSVFDLSPPDLAQVYFEADEALMSAGQDQRYESQVQTPSGQRLDVIFYKSVLRDTEGQVSGLVGTILDITERKRMEQQLAEMATRRRRGRTQSCLCQSLCSNWRGGSLSAITTRSRPVRLATYKA